MNIKQLVGTAGIVVAVITITLWLHTGSQQKPNPKRLDFPIASITTPSGEHLASFFDGLAPNPSVVAALKLPAVKPGECGKPVGLGERVQKLFGFGQKVYAQGLGPCQCTGGCICLGCNQFVMIHNCGFQCDGGNYFYPQYDFEVRCMGAVTDGNRNCFLEGCGCAVSSCSNYEGCGC